jgi:hypothetical protein
VTSFIVCDLPLSARLELYLNAANSSLQRNVPTLTFWNQGQPSHLLDFKFMFSQGEQGQMYVESSTSHPLVALLNLDLIF